MMLLQPNSPPADNEPLSSRSGCFDMFLFRIFLFAYGYLSLCYDTLRTDDVHDTSDSRKRDLLPTRQAAAGRATASQSSLAFGTRSG